MNLPPRSMPQGSSEHLRALCSLPGVSELTSEQVPASLVLQQPVYISVCKKLQSFSLDRVSYSPAGFELQILLSLASKDWDYRSVPHPVEKLCIHSLPWEILIHPSQLWPKYIRDMTSRGQAFYIFVLESWFRIYIETQCVPSVVGRGPAKMYITWDVLGFVFFLPLNTDHLLLFKIY